ncbi:MAG: CHAT domain-containing protein [Bacteroidetes bacterium]|nr:CHAT domain-containing protein [Bacteroidota bacterium]
MYLIFWWFLKILMIFGQHSFFSPTQEGQPSKKETNKEVLTAYNYFWQAKHYLAISRFDSAYFAFEKAIPLYEKIENWDTAYRCYIYLAECSLVDGAVDKADSILHLAHSRLDPKIDTIHYVNAEYLRVNALVAKQKGNLQLAKQLANKAFLLAMQTKTPVDTLLIPFYRQLGSIQTMEGNYNEAIQNYEKAALCKLLSPHKKDIELARIYYNLATLYRSVSNMAKTVSYLDQCISIIDQKNEKDSSLWVNSLMQKVIINETISRLDSCFSILSKIESILQYSKFKYCSFWKVLTFIKKGYIYFTRGDLNRAENYFNTALKVIGNNYNTYRSYLSGIFLNLAIIYYRKDQHTKALEYYKKSNLYCDPGSDMISSNYNGIASCYYYLKDYKKAEEYYNLSINNRIATQGENNAPLAWDYQSYGVFLFLTKRRTEGFDLIKKALAINWKLFGNRYPETAKCYTWLGSFYLDENKPQLALENLQKALICATERFENQNIESLPSLSENYYGPELLKALKLKANALDTLARFRGWDLKLLRNELATYELAIKLINKLRTSFPEFNSKLMVSGDQKNTYLGAINTAYNLYKRTGDPEYKMKAFEIAEKGRSAILLSSLKEKKAVSYGGVPDSLINLEENLNQTIESYQGLILAEKQKKSPNSEVIKELETKAFQLKNQQYQLVSVFEKRFPQYYQLKYDDGVFDVKTIQKRLSRGEALVEYVVMDKNILVFAITGDQYELISVPRTSQFSSSLNTVYSYLHDVSFLGQKQKVYEDFLEASHYLYSVLIEPCNRITFDKQLIIIPDEMLASLPFEILLTDKPDPSSEFGNLPYLIKSQAIGYAYSANLLFFTPSRALTTRPRLAAFSPTYTSASRGNTNLPVLKPLPYANEEARMAATFFKGMVYSGEEATEGTFKKVASRFDVLHLAMHAIVDNDDPMFSKLAFTRSDKGKDDGFLNTYELFNMKLRARMAVLSACNTGAGMLQKGEGVMSLARGFYYAGCPDVVMTLWPVEDRISTQLINDFYYNLSKGMNKIEALRQAKLNLINSSDPLRAHPYFWAGYVNIGDISPIIDTNQKKPTKYWWAIILGAVLIGVAPLLSRWNNF